MPVASVGTAALLVVGNDSSRVSITFRNDSTNDIYLGVGGSSVSTGSYDYHLKPADAVNFNRTEDGDLSTRSFYAIASAAASNLSYLDGVEIG